MYLYLTQLIHTVELLKSLGKLMEDGEHEITITPHNIPLSKMSFKITVEVFGNNKEKPILKKEFNLTVKKKT